MCVVLLIQYPCPQIPFLNDKWIAIAIGFAFIVSLDSSQHLATQLLQTFACIQARVIVVWLRLFSFRTVDRAWPKWGFGLLKKICEEPHKTILVFICLFKRRNPGAPSSPVSGSFWAVHHWRRRHNVSYWLCRMLERVLLLCHVRPLGTSSYPVLPDPDFPPLGPRFPAPMTLQPEVSLWQCHSKFPQPKCILAVVFYHWQQNHTFKFCASTFFWHSCFTPDVESHRAGSHGLHRPPSTTLARAIPPNHVVPAMWAVWVARDSCGPMLLTATGTTPSHSFCQTCIHSHWWWGFWSIHAMIDAVVWSEVGTGSYCLASLLSCAGRTFWYVLEQLFVHRMNGCSSTCMLWAKVCIVLMFIFIPKVVCSWFLVFDKDQMNKGKSECRAVFYGTCTQGSGTPPGVRPGPPVIMFAPNVL